MPRSLALLSALLILAGCSRGSTAQDGGPAAEEQDAGEERDAGAVPSDAGTPSSRLPAVDANAVVAHMTELASDAYAGRDEGTEGGAKARAYILDTLKGCGIQPAGIGRSFEQGISVGLGTNVLGLIPGRSAELSSRYVLVSAHYDHLGVCFGGRAVCNGAADNAAGVAAVLGAACALAKAPPERSVLVALWDAEEPPTFLQPAMGSQFFTTHPTVPLNLIDTAVVADILGSELWPGYNGHFVLGAELSPQVDAVLERVESMAGLTTLRGGLHLVEQTPVGLQPWSDYDAFRRQSVPVLFFSDGQNKRYHTPADDASAINSAKLGSEAQQLARVVWELGNAKVTFVFDANGAQHSRDATTLLTTLEAALAPNGLVDALMLSNASRSKLEEDLASAKAARQTLQETGTLSPTQVGYLRSAAQRVMCFAGSRYAEPQCHLL